MPERKIETVALLKKSFVTCSLDTCDWILVLILLLVQFDNIMVMSHYFFHIDLFAVTHVTTARFSKCYCVRVDER